MNEKLSPPAEVFDEAARLLGSRIRTSERLRGGYTPQALFRLHLADERRAVLKAAPPKESDAQAVDWLEILRREIRVYRELPHFARWRPRFFGDFETGGWAALVIEDLSDARRVPPWTEEEIEACARSLAAMHATTLQDAPADPTLGRETRQRFALVRERSGQRGELPRSCASQAWWHWIDEAAARGVSLFDGRTGDAQTRCFIHQDVRSDNLFLRDGRMLLVDWPDAALKTPFLDSVYWALGVEVEAERFGAPDVHARYLAHAGFISEHDIKEALAFCASYFTSTLQSASSPAHVQRLRLQYLRPTLRWLARELDLDAPPLD